MRHPSFIPGVRFRRAFTAAHARSRATDERGQAMVELAIVLTVLMLIVVGILYFGRYMNYDMDETHIANVAARMAAAGCASSTPGCPNVQSYVSSLATTSELQNGSGDVKTPLQVWVYPTGGGSSVQYGQPITACVQATVQFLPILNIAPITVTRWATMMAETSNAWTPNPPPAGNGCPA